MVNVTPPIWNKQNIKENIKIQIFVFHIWLISEYNKMSNVTTFKALFMYLIIVMCCVWAVWNSQRNILACLALCECFSHASAHVLASWCPAGRAAQPGWGENWTVMREQWMRSWRAASYHRHCWLGSLSSQKMLRRRQPFLLFVSNRLLLLLCCTGFFPI